MKELIKLIVAGVAAAPFMVCVVHAGNAPTESGTQISAKARASSLVNVRYMEDDVSAAIEFYTKHLGFVVEQDSSPAFASVTRGNLRLLLSGKKSSGRRPMKDGTTPVPGGWNRISIWVSDLNAEVRRLRSEGVKFRRDDVVTGPGGSQIWLQDASGNLVELFEPKD